MTIIFVRIVLYHGRVLKSHLGQTKNTSKPDVFCWLRILNGFRTAKWSELKPMMVQFT